MPSRSPAEDHRPCSNPRRGYIRHWNLHDRQLFDTSSPIRLGPAVRLGLCGKPLLGCSVPMIDLVQPLFCTTQQLGRSPGEDRLLCSKQVLNNIAQAQRLDRLVETGTMAIVRVGRDRLDLLRHQPGQEMVGLKDGAVERLHDLAAFDKPVTRHE